MSMRFRAGLDADPGRWRCSSMSCWTASIWASAFSTISPSTRADRNLMMNSIAPIWDGNETWLVLGGLGLLAAFPAGLRHHPARRLFSHPGDAAGADLSRRGVRIPLPRCRASHASGTMPSAMARPSRPSRKAWCWAPSSRASRSRAGISRAGRFDCFTPFSLFTGTGPDVRLCAAGRVLADPENRRRACRTERGAGQARLFPRHLRRGRASSACGRPSSIPISRGAGFPGPTSLFLSPVPLADRPVRISVSGAPSRRSETSRPSSMPICCSACPIWASPSACSP